VKLLSYLLIFLILLGGSALADNPEQIFEKCGPCVVLFKNAEDETFGSGVLVTDKGYILTAAHLFEGIENFSIQLPKGKKIPLRRFLFRDDDLDLAALEVSEKGLPYVEMGRPDSVKIGQSVLAIGNPMGLDNTVSVGIISGKRPWGEDTYLLQTTAPISSGSSGGGLFDDDGRLLAITIAFYNKGQNLNFCVPAHFADLDRIPKLDKLIAAHPDKAEHYRDRAKAYFDCNEYQLALIDVRSALKLDPKDLKAIDLQGECFYEQKRYPEAVEVFDKLIGLAPTRTEGYFDRGYTLFIMDEFQRAIPDLRKVVAANPTHELATSALGRCLYFMDENLEAAEFLSLAINLSPEEASYYYYRGLAYFDAGKHDDALTDMNKSIQLDGETASPYFYRGRLAQFKDQTQDALDAFDKAHKLDGKDGEILYYRALSHIGLYNFETALADLNQAVALGYKKRDVFFFRGLIFTNFSRFDRAVAEFSRALEIEPDYADALVGRGSAYAAGGDTESARKDFKKVLTLEVDEETLQEAREGLEGLDG
jgi:tetratricopeptide (TPR) repeat protein